jgi:hypothetical protein
MRFRSAALLLLLLATGAQAQAPQQRPAAPPAPALSEEAKAVLGAYEFSNSDRDRICGVTLKPEAAANGFKIEFDDRCAAAFPLVGGIVSWRMADNELLRFLDATGKALIEFSEVEGGMYEAPTPGYGVLFLQSAESIAPPAQTVEQVAGEWTIQRASKILCAVTLTRNEIGDDGFALRLGQPCDALVTRFNPTAWRMDRGELVIAAKSGETWRFEDSEGAWRRIPQRADGLTLVKK